MRTFLVSYDLSNPDLNQPYLANAIMGLGEAWARPLDNVWYVRSELAEDEIATRLARLLDEHDGLLVQETRGDAALANAGIRWFRRRRAPLQALPGNVVAFPVTGGTVLTPEPMEADGLRAAG